MKTRFACDARQLQRLIAEELAPAQEASVTEHLNGCLDCQREIESLAGDDLLWQDTIEALSNDAEARATKDGAIPLPFLAPSDDPHSLGRIGHYEVTAVIGRGGTGVVLKAFDGTLHRNVAIKVLAPHLAVSGAARERFARESVAVAAVVHEHIVPIYAVDEFQGVPYLVMRYVPGESLAERIQKQGPLDPLAILRIGLQTAQGLAAAHAQGIVHRDVKPANILMEHGVERLLLTDFGLARTVDDASLTCSGILAGTPQYMAPEQARGSGVEARSDLFSLGCVLYAAATGHSPFRAETTMGVLHRICHDLPRPVRQLNPALPYEVARLIERLLEKQPDRRPASAEEVARHCQQLLAKHQSPEGLPIAPHWRPGNWSGNALTLSAAALVLLGLAIAARFHDDGRGKPGDGGVQSESLFTPPQPPEVAYPSLPATFPEGLLREMAAEEQHWQEEISRLEGTLEALGRMTD